MIDGKSNSGSEDARLTNEDWHSKSVFPRVVWLENSLVFADFHLPVSMNKKLREPWGEVGNKAVGNLTQGELDLLVKLSVMMFLYKRGQK